jgi:hypothetical protein
VPRHWGDRVKRFIQGPTDAESLFFEALAMLKREFEA